MYNFYSPGTQMPATSSPVTGFHSKLQRNAEESNVWWASWVYLLTFHKVMDPLMLPPMTKYDGCHGCHAMAWKQFGYIESFN
jgi:hypothetical protein